MNKNRVLPYHFIDLCDNTDLDLCLLSHVHFFVYHFQFTCIQLFLKISSIFAENLYNPHVKWNPGYARVHVVNKLMPDKSYRLTFKAKKSVPFRWLVLVLVGRCVVTYQENIVKAAVQNCNCISCQIDHLFSVMVCVKYGDRDNEFCCFFESCLRYCMHTPIHTYESFPFLLCWCVCVSVYHNTLFSLFSDQIFFSHILFIGS